MPRPTARACWLLAGALIPAALAALFAPFLWLAVAWIAAVLVLLALDYRRLPGAGLLTLKRVCPRKLSVGARNTITLELSHRGHRPVHLQIKDRVPPELDARSHVREVTLAPRAVTSVRYAVRPPSRGRYEIPAADARVTSSWQLVRKPVQLACSTILDVYPNIRDVGRYQRMLHQRRLRLMGVRPVRKLGKGTEFETLRDYVPDDEYRDINWKATAKADRLITQTFRTEQSQNVILGIEAGRMMTTRVGELTKLDHAINSALLLAHVASTREDRLGLLVFSSDVHTFLAPRRGRRQVTAILEALHDVQPRLVEPDYGSAIKTLRTRQKQRCLFVLFTDLLDEHAGTTLARYLRLLRPTHLPLVAAVSDPTIPEIARATPRAIGDAYRTGVATALMNERDGLLQALRHTGSLVLDSSPGTLTSSVVNRYLEVKARHLL